jgi:lysophospholipase
MQPLTLAPDITLRVGHAMPRIPAEGTILLLHGMGQSIEDYYETINDFLSSGHAVVSFDWYGQGASSHHLSQDPFDPLYQRLHISDVDIYTSHLRAVLAMPDIAALPRPLHVVTHSMGGVLFLNAACTPNAGLPHITRSVPNAPFLAMPLLDSPLGFLARRYLASMAQHDPTSYPISALCHDWRASDRMGKSLGRYTSDPVRGALYNAWRLVNPVLRNGGATALCLQTLYTAMTALRRPERLSHLSIPTHILEAGNEQVVHNRPLKTSFYTHPLITHQVIPGSAHEILNERDSIRDIAMGHIMHRIRSAATDRNAFKARPVP